MKCQYKRVLEPAVSVQQIFGNLLVKLARLRYVVRKSPTKWRIRPEALVWTPGGVLASEARTRSLSVPVNQLQVPFRLTPGDGASREGAVQYALLSMDRPRPLCRALIGRQELFEKLVDIVPAYLTGHGTAAVLMPSFGYHCGVFWQRRGLFSETTLLHFP